jgi:hypothetical protein
MCQPIADALEEASANELEFISSQLAKAGVENGSVEIINGLTGLIRWLGLL